MKFFHSPIITEGMTNNNDFGVIEMEPKKSFMMASIVHIPHSYALKYYLINPLAPMDYI